MMDGADVVTRWQLNADILKKLAIDGDVILAQVTVSQL